MKVYDQSTDSDVRGVVVAMVADQSERTQALALLESIATRPRQAAGFPNSASAAIHSLTFMDLDGAAALKRLYETDAIKDPRARSDLELIAKRGYRTH